MKIGPCTYETNRKKRVKVGQSYVFCYPSEFTSLPEYTSHANQRVKVIRQLTLDECDPECQPMWLVIADDGWQGHASDGELDD